MVNSEGLCPVRDKPCVKDKCMWYMHDHNIARCAVADISKGLQNINHYLSSFYMEGLDISAWILNDKKDVKTTCGICGTPCELTTPDNGKTWVWVGCDHSFSKKEG